MGEIQSFVKALVAEFDPQKVVLFGSYSRGESEGDVDILVIMDFLGGAQHKAAEIAMSIPHSFPLRLVLRTPADVAERSKQQDSFICDVLNAGKILYDSSNNAMGAKGRRGLARRKSRVPSR